MSMKNRDVHRKLISGRLVPELKKSIAVITSKCPFKWVSIDLETGNIWVYRKGCGNTRPSPKEINEIIDIFKMHNLWKKR